MRVDKETIFFFYLLFLIEVYIFSHSPSSLPIEGKGIIILITKVNYIVYLSKLFYSQTQHNRYITPFIG